MNYSATNHCTDKRDVILICLVTSVFIFKMLDGAMSFSRIKTYEIYVNASFTIQVLGGIF